MLGLLDVHVEVVSILLYIQLSVYLYIGLLYFI